MTIKNVKIQGLLHTIDHGEDCYGLVVEFNMNKKELMKFIEMFNCGELNINGVWKE